MNRVVLCGRLAARPRQAYTPCGILLSQFTLLVPKDAPSDGDPAPPIEIDCLAFREAAEQLNLWGEADYRVNLEGRLRLDSYVRGNAERVTGLRVYVDHAYFVDPVRDQPASGMPPSPTYHRANPPGKALVPVRELR